MCPNWTKLHCLYYTFAEEYILVDCTVLQESVIVLEDCLVDLLSQESITAFIDCLVEESAILY